MLKCLGVPGDQKITAHVALTATDANYLMIFLFLFQKKIFILDKSY